MKLPKGVERYSLVTNRDRHREEMRPDDCGSYLCFSDLPAILARRDQEWRDGLLGDEAVGALYESMYGLYRPWRRLEPKKKAGWIKALQAATDKAAPDGGKND